MSEPTLTANAGGTELLNPLLAQWDTSVQMMFDRLDGLTDDEYRWSPTPGAADLVERDGVFRAEPDGDQPTRTIAWTMAHLAEMCWVRADYTDGAKNRALGYGPFPATANEALAELRAGGRPVAQRDRRRDRRAGGAGRLLVLPGRDGPRPAVRRHRLVGQPRAHRARLRHRDRPRLYAARGTR